MANYYKQCDCGRYADVVPCYDCLWEENKRLRDTVFYSGDFIGDKKPITQNCPTCEQLAKEVSLLQKQLKQARSELRGVKKLNEELEREGYNR